MKLKKKIQAQTLRRSGFSITEISNKLDVSKSSVSLWVRNVNLSKAAKSRIAGRALSGRAKAVETNKFKSQKIKEAIYNKVFDEFNNLHYSKTLEKIFCALLYWCEGEKSANSIRFANSDPKLVKIFLRLFRSAFDLDESKFRVCLHLHNYHNEKDLKFFWSNITTIPVSQFIKVYKKKNTGLTIKKDYPGCASIRYNDFMVAIEMEKVYSIFANKI